MPTTNWAPPKSHWANYPQAAEQFQKAIDLVPEHRLALPNLSVVLAKLKRIHEAGEVARRALLVVPGDARMHYILALSLLSENKQTTEALNSLHRASTDIPKAHIVAAEVLASTGRRDEAVWNWKNTSASSPRMTRNVQPWKLVSRNCATKANRSP